MQQRAFSLQFAGAEATAWRVLDWAAHRLQAAEAACAAGERLAASGGSARTLKQSGCCSLMFIAAPACLRHSRATCKFKATNFIVAGDSS